MARYLSSADYAMRQAMSVHLERPSTTSNRYYARDEPSLTGNFQPRENGTWMTITHGPWSQEQDSQTERQGVLEGWIHFGMRLAGLRRGIAT